MVKVEYSTTNSGGSWWLKDEDWKNLEKAGWKVKWYSNPKNCYSCHGTGKDDFWVKQGRDKKPRACSSPYHDKGGRFLGGLATEAEKDFPNIKEAMKEFEEITGQDVTDEGCNCCGPPHTFHWGKCIHNKCGCPPKTPHKDYNYASGQGCLPYLYPNKKIPKNIREAIQEKNEHD